jgi:ABC-2 type transport system permease protein
MFSKLRNYLGLAVAYTRLNLNAQLEYRGAFISQVAAMFLNDGVWVVFWVLFFTRFPVLLPHMLLGKMNATAWGDALFGYVVYFVFVRPDLTHALLFIGLTLACALLFVGFSLLAGSLSFFLGNAAGLSEQWRIAMLTFSTYPSVLFEGAVKIVLFTLIPAGFVTYLPIQALRELSLRDAALTLGGALAMLAIATVVFYLGLRRYESGNLTEMRG